MTLVSERLVIEKYKAIDTIYNIEQNHCALEKLMGTPFARNYTAHLVLSVH